MQTKDHLMTISAVVGIVAFILLLKQKAGQTGAVVTSVTAPVTPTPSLGTIALNYAIDRSQAFTTAFTNAVSGSSNSSGGGILNIPIFGSLGGSGSKSGSSASGVQGSTSGTQVDKFTNATTAQNLTAAELTQLENFFKDIGGNFQAHVLSNTSSANSYSSTVGLSGPVNGTVTVTGKVNVPA